MQKVKVKTNIGAIKAKPETLDMISTLAIVTCERYRDLAIRYSELGGFDYYMNLADDAKRVCDAITEALFECGYYEE